MEAVNQDLIGYEVCCSRKFRLAGSFKFLCRCKMDTQDTVFSQKENTPPSVINSPPLCQNPPSPESLISPHKAKKAFKRPSDAHGSQEKRSRQAHKRRQSAADWIETLTDHVLPATSDRLFRAELRDGVVLCELMNAIRPGCITQARVNDATISKYESLVDHMARHSSPQ